MNLKKYISLVGVFWLLTAPAVIADEVPHLVIVGGVQGEHRVSIVPFQVTGKAPRRRVSDIVRNDLKRTGEFSFIPLGQFPQQPKSPAEVNAGAWAGKKIDYVVVGKVTSSGGRYTLTAQLLHVTGKNPNSPIATFSKTVSASQYRRGAHQLADVVYEKITGSTGVFDTRIAYISSTKARDGRRRFALIVADYDGHNRKVIRVSRSPLMSPRWSPNGRSLAYVAFKANGRTQIRVQDVVTGRSRLISAARGVNGAPAWSPNGRKLALTRSRNGNLDIYVFDLVSRRLKRVTYSIGIDTEARWTPNGRSLIFTSDRGGKPQLYRVSASGGRAVKLTSGNYNAGATVSRKGDIAMVHNYKIGYMKKTSSGYDQIIELTRGTLDESPSFAPNGKLVIYASRYSRRGVLWTTSTTARSVDKALYRVEIQSGDIREPAWGPKRR
jgi:TolB protein